MKGVILDQATISKEVKVGSVPSIRKMEWWM
jgi:hypothetical protein